MLGCCRRDRGAAAAAADRHADYVNDLVAEGFTVLRGPMVGTRDVLLIVRAQDQAEVEARLAADCWSVTDLLRTRQISPWWLRLGSLGDP
jgi:uncharacterized protein YciI